MVDYGIYLASTEKLHQCATSHLTKSTTKALPPLWEIDFPEPWKKLGTLTYRIDRNFVDGVAYRTISYWPFDELMGNDAARLKGLPYFIESITTRRMMRLGLTHVRTSGSPSEKRIIQLKRVGIQACTVMPAEQWLMAMGRGIRWHFMNRAQFNGLGFA